MQQLKSVRRIRLYRCAICIDNILRNDYKNLNFFVFMDLIYMSYRISNFNRISVCTSIEHFVDFDLQMLYK
jgi:hypothetical protein